MEVDYREDPKKISEAIVRNIIKLLANFFREKLENICRKAMVSVSGKKKSESRCLIDQFGSGGAEAVVNHLTAFAALRNISHV